jgi:hypothetical protein
MNDFFLKKDYNRYVHPSEIFEWQVLDVNKGKCLQSNRKKNHLIIMIFVELVTEVYYSNVPDEVYYSNVPDEVYYSNVPDEVYYSNVPDEVYYSNVPDEVYYSNVGDHY